MNKDQQFIQDQRLKAYYEGLSNGQRALARVQRRLIKDRSRISKKEFKPKDGDNTNIKELAIGHIDLRMSYMSRERHIQRCKARATHLLRQFLRGKPYKCTEMNVKAQTIPAETVIFNFFPASQVENPDHKLFSEIQNWLKVA